MECSITSIDQTLKTSHEKFLAFFFLGGEDSNSFSLITRPGWDKADILTTVDLDYESPRKKFEMVIRAASPPLRNDVRVEILVTDVNDNAPILKDFQVIIDCKINFQSLKFFQIITTV